MLVHEERGVRARSKARGAHFAIVHVEIVTQALESVRPQRNEALATALAADHDALVRFVQVAAVDGDDLAHTDTSGIQRLEDRAITRSQEIGVIGSRKQPLDLVHRDRLGQTASLLGRANQSHRIGGGEGALLQPLVEATKGGDLARHRRRRIVLLGKLGEEAADALHIARQDGSGDRCRDRLLGRRGIERRLFQLHV